MNSSGPINILTINAIAIVIAEGADNETLDLLSAYFFLLGSALKSLSVTRVLEQKKAEDC